MEIRLNKYLKETGIASRRKADEFIEKGYVLVNGVVVTELGTKVDPEKDKVEIKQELKDEVKNYSYILFYKPRGVVTTKNKNEGKTVFDYLPEIEGLTYAGRLDKESEGLLILSNDGEFVFRLSYPDFEKEKEYSVVVDSEIHEHQLEKMRNGMEIEGKMTKPAIVRKIGKYSYNIILTEGMNRQIRRMAERTGLKVIELKRFRIKNINGDHMKPGTWRNLTTEEISDLKK